jgi:NADP-dependent 3-hydroxy acid dehydrogenase YdfG
MNNIKGKTVVITGASSGFGAVTAKHLASLGAKVVLGARSAEKLNQIVSEITDAGGAAIAVQTDVTDRAQVQGLVDAALAQFGRIDVMINNAGLMANAPIDALKVDEWDAMIDINVKGVLYGIAAALPVFRKQDTGHFINLASVGGIKVAAPGGVVYSGTKFAVHAISEGLRVECGPKIRCTTLSPGAVDSELKYGSSDGETRDRMVAFYEMAIPTQTIADAIAYAISQPANVDINDIVLRPTAQEF